MSKIFSVPRLLLVTLMIVGFTFAQTPPPSNLVTIPTAGTIQRGTYEVEMLMLTGGGVLGRLGVGFSDKFSIGMSYGIQKFIGSEEMDFNRPIPEAQLKYRFLDETVNLPAIAMGIDTQGRGIFEDHDFSKMMHTPTVEDPNDSTLAVREFSRYDQKALGVYVVISKNWSIGGNLATHFGLCKNFIEEDEMDEDINIFFGIDKELGEEFSLFVEFNAALDDNNYTSDEVLKDINSLTFGKGQGYLNAGLRWHVAPTFYLELDVNDIMVNRGNVDHYARELKVVYNDYF